MNGIRTLLPNAWYVAAREYKTRVGTRSFLIGTVILAAIAFAATEAPVLVDALVSSSQTKMVVVNQASNLPSDAVAVLDQKLNISASMDASAKPPFVVTWKTADQLDAATKATKAREYGALLVVARGPEGNLAFTLKTDMAADGSDVRVIDYAAQQLGLEDRLVRGGQPVGSINVMQKFDVQPISEKSGEANSIARDISSSLLSTGLIVLIFMAIITYGTWVAMSVAEEKGSRVMELMLNAATPLQMLAGKVIGNGAAGISQYGVILGVAIVGVLMQGRVHEAITGNPADGSTFAGLTPAMLAGFAVLFVLGFSFYSLLYAGLGSLVSRQEDVQSATSPLMMLIMVGYFISVFSLEAINEVWVRVLSFVPFFSPYLMLARIAVGEVAPWEFALAAAILVVSIGVALVVAARIYSAGVLLYGQRVGLREIWKASRVAR
jgi:ABC-2 type transport system permease protein